MSNHETRDYIDILITELYIPPDSKKMINRLNNTGTNRAYDRLYHDTSIQNSLSSMDTMYPNPPKKNIEVDGNLIVPSSLYPI